MTSFDANVILNCKVEPRKGSWWHLEGAAFDDFEWELTGSNLTIYEVNGDLIGSDDGGVLWDLIGLNFI